MEFVVVLKDKSDIDKYKNKGINNFIFGLSNYSVHYPEISIKEIEDISKTTNIFVAINKNIFNSELDDLKEKLVLLSKLNILGVLFYDLGVLHIVRQNKLNLDLVWHQTHMVTNYNTCNYYYDKGVKYGYLANEITLDERLEVISNTDMKLMTQVFGYLVMSHSRRSLLSNFFKSINEDRQQSVYNIKDRLGSYIVYEKNSGTSIFYGQLINGTKPLFSLVPSNLAYGVIDTQLVDNKLCMEVIEVYQDILNNYDLNDLEKQERVIKKMNKLIGEYTGFFYQKTFYKVKRD